MESPQRFEVKNCFFGSLVVDLDGLSGPGDALRVSGGCEDNWEDEPTSVYHEPHHPSCECLCTILSMGSCSVDGTPGQVLAWIQPVGWIVFSTTLIWS